MLKEEAVVLKNSPIEFVIIGPYKGRDRILLRSDNAGLDLIGMATQDEISFKGNPIDGLSILIESPRQLNIVRSYDVPTLGVKDHDDRESSLRFVWAGLCNKYDSDRIEAIFNRLRYDIRSAILNGTLSDIEMSISSVVLWCSRAQQKQLKKKVTYRIVLGIYGIVALLLSIYVFFKYPDYIRK